MEIKCKTRTEDTSPNGKPRVFFCSTKKDFDIYFDEITKDILDIVNCAIYYLDYESDYENDPELFELLETMQLVLVPVTSELLFINGDYIKDHLLAYFIHTKRKPLIPIVLEKMDNDNTMLSLFENHFGQIQYLDKYGINDKAQGTEIPYKVRLGKILKDVLIGDELAQKIRASFDAHIFLSYRKKDRKEAQKLMHLIHSDPMCEDIAIWYDEYLTPGNDYNKEIAEAIENCDAFVFNVTESFLEKENYVVKIEYPEAVKSKKPLIPVEMRPTDKDSLEKMCNGIDEKLITIDEHSKVCSVTFDFLKEIINDEHRSNPIHTFFLGLAYLNGIDVEVDEPRGEKLLISAAERGIPEAMDRLAHLYFDGKSQPEIDKAATWQKKAVAKYKDKLLQSDSDKSLFDCFKASAEYLIQLYCCNKDAAGISFCIETIEELGQWYSDKVLKQTEVYKDIFISIEYLRISAATLSVDNIHQQQIVDEIESSYMDYFLLSQRPEDAYTLIDILCTIAQKIKANLYRAYNKLEIIKAKFRNLIPDIAICKMYISVCRVLTDNEQVSPAAKKVYIDQQFIENEFGWWKYVKEAYTLCAKYVQKEPENLEWKKMYCESLYILGRGLANVVSKNININVAPELSKTMNLFLDEFDKIYPTILTNEPYTTKCSYIDAAFQAAALQFSCNFNELLVIKKYEQALKLAKHLEEEYKTRESWIFYLQKLIFCTGFSFHEEDAVIFLRKAVKEAVTMARSIHEKENTIQTAIWLGEVLNCASESKCSPMDHEECLKELNEAISIYESLSQKNLNDITHRSIEQNLLEFYRSAHYYACKREHEEEAISYLNKGMELGIKMFEENKQIIPDFKFSRDSALYNNEHMYYKETWDQIEKKESEIKEEQLKLKIVDLLDSGNDNAILAFADQCFKDGKYDTALMLYTTLADKATTRYLNMFTCMQKLNLPSDMLSIYPKVVSELERAANNISTILTRVCIEKDVAEIYVDQNQYLEAKKHLLNAQHVYEQTHNKIVNKAQLFLLEKCMRGVDEMLKKCNEML